jgi:hypothetical protein
MYSEKIIKDVLHYQLEQGGEWYPYDIKTLSKRVLFLERVLVLEKQSNDSNK